MRRLIGPIVTALVLVGAVVWFADADTNDVFQQAAWSGNAVATATLPQATWTNYSAKDANLDTSGGYLKLAQTSTVNTDTTDTQFNQGTQYRTTVSGAGAAAVVTLDSTLDDPFVGAPQRWANNSGGSSNNPATSPPMFHPRISKYLKVGNYIYAIFDFNYIGKFDVTKETTTSTAEEWVFLKRAPTNFGVGAGLAYPGAGNYLYVLCGGGSKDFLRYDTVNDVWAALANAPYFIDAGACIVGTAHGASGRIYCHYGWVPSSKFGYYDIAANTWTDRTNLSVVVNSRRDFQAKLVYPGSGNDIFWLPGVDTGNASMYKYTIVDGGSDTWSANITGGVSRGTNGGGDYVGGYIYTWAGVNASATLTRYSVAGGGSFTDLTGGLPNSPKGIKFYINGPSILYDPGSGNYYKFLDGSRRYLRPMLLDKTDLATPTTAGWKTDLQRPIFYSTNTYGLSAVAGSGAYSGYIYYYAGDYNPGRIYQYDIAGDSWTLLTTLPAGWGATRAQSLKSLAYDTVNDRLYLAVNYSNGTTGAGKFGYYALGGASWTDLSVSAPPSAPINYQTGGMIYVNFNGHWLYALRGNSTNNLYRFNIDTPGWTSYTLPYNVSYDGGNLAYPGAGQYLYYHATYTAGANGGGFYRFDMTNGNVDVLSNRPYGTYNFGATPQLLSVPTDTRYLYYLLSPNYAYYGSRGLERYDTQTGTWSWLAPPPAYFGSSGMIAATASAIYHWSFNSGCIRYNLSTDTWSEDGVQFDAPEGLARGSAVKQGNMIYYFITANYPSSTVLTFDASTMEWTGAFRVPFMMSVGAKAALRPGTNEIYVTQGAGNRFWMYDTAAKTWTQKGNIPSGAFTDYTTFEGYDSSRMYLIPENQSSYGGNVIYQYSPGTDLWNGGVACPGSYISPTGHALCAVPSKGGLYWATPGSSANWYLYNVSNDSWSAIATPNAWTPGPADPYGTQLYYPGSGDDIWTLTNDYLWKFNVGSATWTQLTPAYQLGLYNTFLWPSGDYLNCFASGAGAGDIAEAFSGLRLFRYKISANQFDSPLQNVFLYSPAYPGAAVIAHPLLNRLYFYYSSDTWAMYDHDRSIPPSFGRYSMNDNGNTHGAVGNVMINNSVEFTPSYYVFSAYGAASQAFRRYDMRTDQWASMANLPAALTYGASGAGTKDWLVMCLGNASDLWKYDVVNNTWSTYSSTLALPATSFQGSAMCYPARGNDVYLLRGNGTSTFWKIDISNIATDSKPVSITAMAPLPVIAGGIDGVSSYNQSELFYPGVGDYLYCYPTGSYTYNNDGARFFRYSMLNNTWEELQSCPVMLYSRPQLFRLNSFPDYLFAQSSLDYSYTNNQYHPAPFYLWKSGTYTSKAMTKGSHLGFGAMTWVDNITGTDRSKRDVYVKVRTDTASAMTNAAAWDSCPWVAKGQDISGLSSVRDGDAYIQYRVYLYGYDMTSGQLPTVDSVTINFDQYPTSRTLTSSAFNTTAATNRLMKLSWTETALPAGTDVRAQLRTAPDAGGAPGAWSGWYGPGNTTSLNYDFSNAAEYAKSTEVTVSGGAAALMRDAQQMSYTQEVVVDNTGLPATPAGESVIVTLTIDAANPMGGHFRSSGADVRFYDGSAKLAYRLISIDSTSRKAVFFIKIPSPGLTAGQVKVISMIYGASDVASDSDAAVLPVPSNGLVGYWSFDEGTGSAANDTSGNSNHGSVIGGVNWVAGRFGNALEFPGAGAAGVKIPDAATLRPSPDMTVSLWYQSYPYTSANQLFGREYGVTTDNSIALWHSASNRVSFMTRGSSTLYNDLFYTGTNTLTGRYEWHMVTAVKSGTTLRLFQDGALITEGAASADILYSVGKPLFIGADCNNNSDDPDTAYKGRLDEVVLYNRALSEREIQSLYLRNHSGYAGNVYTADNAPAFPESGATSATLGVNWPYRETIKLTNASAGALTDYTVALDIDLTLTNPTSGNGFWQRIRSDGADLRLVDSDNTTLLSHNVAQFDYTNKNALVLVKVPSIPAASSKEIYLYYGNAGGTTVSDNTVGGTLPVSASDYLVGWWKLDESAGPAVDSSATGANAVWTNTPTVMNAGVFGNALTFNGSSNYARAPYSASQSPVDQMTQACWAYSSDWVNAAGYFMGQGYSTVGGVSLGIDAGLPNSVLARVNSYYDELSSRRLYSRSSKKTLLAGWHHFASTYDGQALAFYIDGELVDTQSFPQANSPIYYSTTQGYLIGARPTQYDGAPGAGTYFNGSVDQVTLYSRALTAAEVKSLAVGGADYTIASFKATESSNAVSGSAYYTDNPTVQPILGAYYDSVEAPLAGFTETISTPSGTAVQYQVSPNGYDWYYWTGTAWAAVTGGYSQANPGSVINTNIAAVMTTVAASGEFFFRAYLNSSGTNTPSLNHIKVDLSGPPSFYQDPTGAAEVINQLHTDVVNDQWFQYRVTLYSDGLNTPTLDQLSVESITASLALTAPLGGTPPAGEAWPIGASRDVTWSKNGMTDVGGVFAETVKLDYSTDGGSTWRDMAGNLGASTTVANTSPYAWTLPNTHTAQARVRITSNGWPSLTSQSTANFRIVGTIALTTPNGGQRWVTGGATPQQTVAWTSNIAQIPQVTLEYSTNSGSTWRDMAGVAGQSTTVSNTGTYAWTIPDTITSGDTCLFRISDTVDANTKAQSAAGFRIINQFTVTQPAAGAALTTGSTNPVAWTSDGTGGGSVKLSYSLSNGADGTWRDMVSGVLGQETTATNVKGSNTYSWTMPGLISETCKIKVADAADSTVFGLTGSFAIQGFRVTAPNGGQEWEWGTTPHDLTWQLGDAFDIPIKVYLSTDGGATYKFYPIILRNLSFTTYSWTIDGSLSSQPDQYGPGMGETLPLNCRIKVQDTLPEGSGGPRVDISDANFTIVPVPAIAVTAPAGAEQWIAGTSHNVTWTPTGRISSNLAIEYSVDNGDWTAVSPAPSAGQIDAKSYPWTVYAATLSNNVKIRIRETAIPLNPNGDLRDTQTLVSSPTVQFGIIAPTITITAPTTAGETVPGSVWVVGDGNGATAGRTIAWSSTGTLVDSLTLQYSVNGTNWNPIATFTQAQYNGSYTWKNLPSGAVGDTVLLRLSDGRSPTPVSDDSEPIRILPYQRVILTQPQTNNNPPLIQGDTYTITWTWDGQVGADNLWLYYSTDGGANYTIIDGPLVNSPTTSPWAVTGVTTSQARVKIVDLSHPTETFFETGNFSISIPQIIVGAPLAGANLFRTGTYNVTWTTQGQVSENIIIEYQFGSGSWTAVSPAPSAGQISAKSYPWVVPDNPSATCQVQVRDGFRQGVQGLSGTLNLVEPVITIGAPTGSETGANAWVVGTDHNITWTTTGVAVGAVSGLTAQYSSTGAGGAWTTCRDQNNVQAANLAAATTSFAWRVADAVSDNVYIKIFDPGRTVTTATSSRFELKPPSVTLTSPNTGAESWIIGTAHDITWYAVGAVTAPLKLSYTADGQTWTDIADAQNIPLSGDGQYSYAWTVPNAYAAGTASVKVTDSYTPTPRSDTSNASFTIALPTIAVTQPGELWSATDVKAIAWTSVGALIGPLRVEWSTDNFVTPTIISSTVDKALTSYDWTIDAGAVGAATRTRVTDLGRPLTTGKTNAFTVLPVPTITISAPTTAETGADAWRIGKLYTITWSDNGGAISNNLKLQYSVNNGSTWTDIVAQNQANGGTYPWTVPANATPSVQAKIKIYDNTPWKSGTNLSVESGAFEIAIPRITVTAPAAGAYWAVGDAPLITWTTDGLINNNLALQYSVNGGTDYSPIASGETNDGTFNQAGAWTVPDVTPTGTARIKIIDASSSYGGQPVSGTTSNFNILAVPTVTVTAPASGAVYVLGDTLPITWTSRGLQVQNVKIEYSSDNFTNANNIRTIIASVANTPNSGGSYNWVIPESALSGATITVRVSMVGNANVQDASDNFRIRGGFTVTAPTLAQRCLVGKLETVTWTTRGTIANVKVKYSSNSGGAWTTIVASTPNTTPGTYSFAIPEPRGSTTSKVRIEDASDDTVYEDSALFKADYYTINWRVLDYDTNAPLQALSVQDTAWTDQTATLAPAVGETTINHDYPYRHYTTFWSKSGYIERAVEWDADSDKTVSAALENQLTATVEWHVLMSTAYLADTDTLNASTWLERRGKLVGAVATDLPNLQSATLEVYDGSTLLKTMTTTTHDNRGVFWFSWTPTALAAGKTYFVKSAIAYQDSTYTSGASVDVTSAKATLANNTLLQAAATQNAAIQSAVQSTIPAQIAASQGLIETKVDASRTALETKVDSAKTAITADTTKILTATQTTLPAQIDTAKTTITDVIKSEILNSENTIRSGQTLTIRFRTYSGLLPALDVYDPKNSQKLVKGLMTEVGTTGIYEYPLKFLTGWGRGDFTIVCSESTKGTMDAVTMSVLKTDVEQVAGQVSAVLGTTSGISGLQSVASTLNSQFNLIETALSKVGKDMVKEVKEAAASAMALESVYSQLSGVSKQIKELTGNSGVNLEKLYTVSEEKKQDMVYLKNKTQELKAAMEMSQKMVDNIANKPVTQTWYEYK